MLLTAVFCEEGAQDILGSAVYTSVVFEFWLMTDAFFIFILIRNTASAGEGGHGSVAEHSPGMGPGVLSSTT